MTPLLCTSLTFAFILITVTPAHGAGNVVIQWNSSALEAVRQSKMGPPMVARALAIAHTCMYDAWAAYDDEAIGTQLAATLRRPEAERNEANRSKAISYAAYLALSDLFPAQKSVLLDAQMISLGFDPADHSTNPATPSGIGNLACAAVLSIRHNDGSNQLGNLTASGVPYADYTGYVPVNPPSTVPVNPATVADVNSWQPLQYFDATGKFVTQRFLAAQWLNVTPFALSSGSEFRDTLAKMGPARFGSPAFLREAEEVIDLSAHLTDRQKMVAEYWKDGPNSETPPGHWCLFAQFVSTRDNHSLSDDVKMFFAMTNATFDSSIVAWDAKRAFDSVRPATAIPFLFQGKSIQAWGGPLKGTITMDGSQWIPYQPRYVPDSAVSRIHLRPQHLQRGRRNRLASFHGERRF